MVFINSCIPWDNNLETFTQIINLSYRCGYQAAFVNVKTKLELDTFLTSPFFPSKRPTLPFPLSAISIMNYKTDQSPIALIPKITISVQNPDTLKNELQYYIQKRCLIAIQSDNKETLELAARDGRVDIISVPTHEFQKNLSKGIFSLIRQNHCMLDISLTPIIESEFYERAKVMRSLYRLFLNAKFNSYQYILGLHSNKHWLLRGPHENIAILKALFNIPEIYSKQILRENAETMALRFIKRDLGLFIEPDVEILDIRPKKISNQQEDLSK